jgi:hypothetical protein
MRTISLRGWTWLNAYWNGRMDRAYDISLEIVKAGLKDPIAACLRDICCDSELRTVRPADFLIGRYPEVTGISSKRSWNQVAEI